METPKGSWKTIEVAQLSGSKEKSSSVGSNALARTMVNGSTLEVRMAGGTANESLRAVNASSVSTSAALGGTETEEEGDGCSGVVP